MQKQFAFPLMFRACALTVATINATVEPTDPDRASWGKRKKKLNNHW